MFCPRCGAENQAGSRYCVSCGNELDESRSPSSSSSPKSQTEKEQRQGFRAGLDRVIGTTRRARLISLGTAAALIVAVVAFIALAPADDDEQSVPQDAFTKALDASCVGQKTKIAAAQQQALKLGTLAAVSSYGESIVPIAGAWKDELDKAVVPADRTALVDTLSAALLEVEIEAATLARAARESNRRELATAATRTDAATANVEVAIQGLGLERCSQLEIAAGRLIRQ